MAPIADPSDASTLALTKKVDELTRAYGEAVGTVNRLTGEVNRLTGQNNQLTDQVNHLSAANNTLVSQLNRGGASGEINRLTAEVNRLTGENNTAVGRINELVALNNGLTGEINQLTGAHNELVGQLNLGGAPGEINRLTTDVNRLTTDVNRLTGLHNEAVGQVNQLTDQVNHLTDQNNKLTEHNNSLVGEMNLLAGGNNTAVSRVNVLTQENNALTSERNALVGKVNQLTSDNNHFVGRINVLAGKNNELTGKNNLLVGRVNALVGTINKLTGANSSLTGNISMLARENTDLADQIESLKAEVFELTQSLVALERETGRAAARSSSDRGQAGTMPATGALGKAAMPVELLAPALGPARNRKAIFLVVSNLRSGSTWLQAMLGSLPDVFTDYEFKWGVHYSPLDVHRVLTPVSPTVRQTMEAVEDRSPVVGSKLVFDPIRLTHRQLEMIPERIGEGVRIIHLVRNYRDIFLSRRRGVLHRLRRDRSEAVGEAMREELLRRSQVHEDATEVHATHVEPTDTFEELANYLANDIWVARFAGKRDYLRVNYTALNSRFDEIAAFAGSKARQADIRLAVESPPTIKLEAIEPDRLVSNMSELEPIFQHFKELQGQLLSDTPPIEPKPKQK